MFSEMLNIVGPKKIRVEVRLFVPRNINRSRELTQLLAWLEEQPGQFGNIEKQIIVLIQTFSKELFLYTESACHDKNIVTEKLFVKNKTNASDRIRLPLAILRFYGRKKNISTDVNCLREPI